MVQGEWNHPYLLKYAMFLEIGVKKLRFESGKGLDFLKSENAMRTTAVHKCATILLSNVRGVPSMIYFNHINIDLTNMKCRSQLDISSKFNIANEYVLCRYKWHHPIVLIGHSFGRLMSKSLVVKLKRKSTIRNRINSKLACTCSLLFVQCLLQNQRKHRRIKENTLAQIEKNREKKDK